MKRGPLVATFILFIALCVSAAFWVMQLFKPPVRPVAAPPQTAQAMVPLDSAASLFGGKPVEVVVSSNFQLTGVVVAPDPKDSIAILVTDTKPPQSIRVNGEIMPGVTLKEVHKSHVLLLERGVVKRVELPDAAKLLNAAMTPVPATLDSRIKLESSQSSPNSPPQYRLVVPPSAQPPVTHGSAAGSGSTQGGTDASRGTQPQQMSPQMQQQAKQQMERMQQLQQTQREFSAQMQQRRGMPAADPAALEAWRAAQSKAGAQPTAAPTPVSGARLGR